MPYSLDLRQKVINFIEKGGTITEAAHTFGIGRASIYRWLSRPQLEATKVKSRRRKLDWKELEKDVKENPESKLSDRAKKFGVNPTAIFYALKKMKITRKKNKFVIDKEVKEIEEKG
ncbi:MAG: IS630 transposase-related protein [Trichodesmium sp. St5_bin2_1]|nr:IS630 transposase-related protein [Trichodesmium sp. St5_bin2_1]